MKFEKEEFVSIILNEAEKKNLLEETKKELELFEKYDQIEYLFIIKEFVLKLEEIGVSYIILRMAGATSVIAYLLGIHKINPVKYKLSNKFFFDKKYEDMGIGPRFDICVPKNKKDEAIKILNCISSINNKTSSKSIYRFGENDKYRLGIYEHGYLDRLNDAIELVDLKDKCNKIDFTRISEDCNYQEVMNYMLKLDDKGYYMPNLNGCVMGIPSEFYELMDAVKPKDLYDLAKINCLAWSNFKSKKKVLDCIRDNGIDGTIYSREQLLNIFIDVYEIEENEALKIVEDNLRKNKLAEGEELILKSHEVPESVLNQLDNIKYLHYMSISLQKMHIAYTLAKIKNLGCEFDKLIHVSYKNSFVGPFFYINKKLYSYTDKMINFNGNLRFFDSPMSHFKYFDSLLIEGDYGNFPRGRVIFDNFHKKFIVYMDKDLFTDNIKSLIIHAYGLEKEQTKFKRDSHYTHNWL